MPPCSQVHYNPTPHTSTALTSPAQKMLLGHHAWLGGSGTWDGRDDERGALGLATTVDTVMDGAVTLLVTGPWGRARAPRRTPEESSTAGQCTILSGDQVVVGRSGVKNAG